MKADIQQGVRDAIENLGELVSYRDAGVHNSEIWLHIEHDVEVYSSEGTQKISTARGMKSDLPKLSIHAKFVTESGEKYGFKKTLKDNGVSILMAIGEVAAA